MKIAYITDSATGKSIEELAKDQIFSLPLQITDDDTTYFDLENFSVDQCITLLNEKKVFKTSLPALGLIDDLIANIKKQGFTRVIAVMICPGLSGTTNAIAATCKQYEIECKTVDTGSTANLQEYIIKYIQKSLASGLNEKLVFENVDKIIASAQTLIIPEDMHHLQRGGRLTPFAATLAELLKIKPILEINLKTNGRIDVLEKVRTFTKAIDKVINKHLVNNVQSNYVIYIAHVDCYDKAEIVKAKLKSKLPNVEIIIEPLCNPVSCHCGLKSIAIQYFMKL